MKCEEFSSLVPEDFNFELVEEFWHDIKTKFVNFFQDFNANGKFFKGSNSLIMLILKSDNPLHLRKFRQISFVRCIFKIVVKILASRKF